MWTCSLLTASSPWVFSSTVQLEITATLTLYRASANPLVNYEDELTSFILENCAINMDDNTVVGWDHLWMELHMNHHALHPKKCPNCCRQMYVLNFARYLRTHSDVYDICETLLGINEPAWLGKILKLTFEFAKKSNSLSYIIIYLFTTLQWRCFPLNRVIIKWGCVQ